MVTVLQIIKRFTPGALFDLLQSPYHFALALISAAIYRLPSREIRVVAITGTKGKSSTAELVNALLMEAGYTTALANTIRFKVAGEERRNLYKMTMPGRFFLQSFLRRAVRAGCEWAVIEMTSEGAKLHRHRFIDLDALIFTNLAPEHIEAHGSFEKYLVAKLSIRDQLERSHKAKKWMVANADDPQGARFLQVKRATPTPFSLADAAPYSGSGRGLLFSWDGAQIHSPLVGLFNLENLIAATAFAKTQGIGAEVVKRVYERFSLIKGRVERVECGQSFDVIVDYAHTPDSLQKLYEAFPNKRKICVLGNTGGGRDRWKRPLMGKIAMSHCAKVILTNEDPYDEDPATIVHEMEHNMGSKKPEIILDRREAIKKALTYATRGDLVLITGKGTDPYIMGPQGAKIPWSDFDVAQEELSSLLDHKEHGAREK